MATKRGTDQPADQSANQPAGESAGLIRGMGLGGAVSLNMLDMIGVGPFITLPLVVAAMHGPQAMLGWVAGRGPGDVRRPGDRRTGRFHAQGRRLVRISQADLRAEEAWAAWCRFFLSGS